MRGRVESEEPPFRANGGAAPVWLWRVCVGAGELANADGRLCGWLFALR